jgi:LacI family transcriptional regulator, gluconate utilization system Gnt-I transcriptional repressor
VQSPKTTRKPTLSEVAALAGVSEITASRALRGSAAVTERTVKKVQEAADSLGYLRNRLAGALAGGPSNQVGVILPSLSNIVFPDVLKGLEDRLEHAGFHPVLGISNYDPQQEEQLIRNLLSWRPAGLVIAPCGLTETSRHLLASAGLPVVEIMDIDTPPVDMAVGMSHRSAGMAMARHLIGRGYRRPAYVGHDIDRDRRATARLEGFREGLAAAGLGLSGLTILHEPSSVALGRRGLSLLLESCDAKPDLVYFSNDDMAVGGMFYCMAECITVPEDLAIAGFNGLELGQSLPVPLTTTASHRTRIGEIAAASILDRLNGEETPRLTDVGFSLIPGGTA